MRKFLSTIGYLWIAIVLVVVGIMGIVGFTAQEGAVYIVNLLGERTNDLNIFGALMVAIMAGGFGGGIGMAVLTIANFFKQKTRSS